MVRPDVDVTSWTSSENAAASMAASGPAPPSPSRTTNCPSTTARWAVGRVVHTHRALRALPKADLTVSLPKAALAMWSGVEELVLTPTARAELECLVELVAPTAVDLNALDADMLEKIEILVGSWGGNVLDADLLGRLPKLRLLAYAAGTVKSTITPATWEHGVVVSSAAAANAVPVAEFTFAAIIMIAKDVFRTRDRHREVRGQEPVG